MATRVPEYLPRVLLYRGGQAYDGRSIDKGVRIGDSTTLGVIVRRLKAIGALGSDVKVAALRQDDSRWPYRLVIVRKRDGRALVELDRFDE